MAKADDPPFGRKQQDMNVHEWSRPVSDLDLRVIRDEAVRKITKPGRTHHIKKTQLKREKLATALREVEKTIPLKSGSKYIENNLRPNLLNHLPQRELPSDSTLKTIMSMMKRGQL